MIMIFSFKIHKDVENNLFMRTVKLLLFSRTLFSHKFARASGRKNKVLDNNF